MSHAPQFLDPRLTVRNDLLNLDRMLFAKCDDKIDERLPKLWSNPFAFQALSVILKLDAERFGVESIAVPGNLIVTHHLNDLAFG